ncbi:Anthranilate synthase, amidotransferase component / Para-aminobenzoate synthase, amidotransferase component [Lunatimonas lonarensis]|uniref:Anthranilate synthase, amidotransferase component / Para-aminobenzoate synthase, amidotransferase component n=1 Tax=Lunatimonas lonarensis TaxID=1232681 RepID=R7ZVR8_9BACT|nr:aminodeoxychorismate/anthranilate synthase component II [Lunatimonas lonarensis]EON78182.1 Anthranilate synthase, amidotransferase component / Para-aminobenzoate synthase, amidotransferase component [Lunatimonas lonarensis]
MKILVLDNYDSFTYNLVYIVRELGYGKHMDIYRNDKIRLEDVAGYDKILLSPGPGVPEDAGIMPALLKQYGSEKDILGVCLGHQAIGEAYGSGLINLTEVVHGVASKIKVKEDLLFKGLPESFTVGRYHSWVIDESTLPSELEVIAKTPDGQIMAVRHVAHRVRGVQFHPESILTEHGVAMMQNWLGS